NRQWCAECLIRTADFETRGPFHRVDRQVARIENQLVRVEAVEVQRGEAFDDFPVEMHAEVQIEVAYARPIGPGEGMDIHSFHDRIRRQLLLSESRVTANFISSVLCLIRNRRESSR